MKVMLGDIRLDRIEESSDIGNVPRLGVPDAKLELPEPCLGWLQPDVIDPVMAAATRRRVLKQLADTDILMLTQHFPVPSAGHVFTARTGFGLRYLEGGMVMGKESTRWPC